MGIIQQRIDNGKDRKGKGESDFINEKVKWSVEVQKDVTAT